MYVFRIRAEQDCIFRCNSFKPYIDLSRFMFARPSRHLTLTAEKYVDIGSPHFSLSLSLSPPALRVSLSAVSFVLASSQMMALWRGSPVARSHTTVVSRWLVMPTEARQGEGRPDADSQEWHWRRHWTEREIMRPERASV